jgi:CRP-like cAMP-binding protein
MENLKHFLSASGILGEGSIDLLLSKWNDSQAFKSNELILSTHQKAHYLYFVNRGSLRLFLVNKKEEDITIGFGYKNSIITSFDSFIDESPSLLSIAAIEDVELIKLSKKNLEHCIESDHTIATWYQSVLEKTISGHIKRQTELLMLSPKERYEVFLKRSGHLINSVPLKHIASYLGMKPETLSRVRNKIS